MEKDTDKVIKITSKQEEKIKFGNTTYVIAKGGIELCPLYKKL